MNCPVCNKKIKRLNFRSCMRFRCDDHYRCTTSKISEKDKYHETFCYLKFGVRIEKRYHHNRKFSWYIEKYLDPIQKEYLDQNISLYFEHDEFKEKFKRFRPKNINNIIKYIEIYEVFL